MEVSLSALLQYIMRTAHTEKQKVHRPNMTHLQQQPEHTQKFAEMMSSRSSGGEVHIYSALVNLHLKHQGTLWCPIWQLGNSQCYRKSHLYIQSVKLLGYLECMLGT